MKITKIMKIVQLITLVLMLGVIFSGVSAAKAKADDGLVSTRYFSSPMIPGYCPTEINGRQVLFLENVYAAAPQVLGIDISRLGGMAAASAEGPYKHQVVLEAYIAGTGEFVGSRTENNPFFESGVEYFTNIQLTRELTQDEMNKIYVVMYVDGAKECQRTLICDPMFPIVIKEHFTLTRQKALQKDQDVIITIDKHDLGKDYFAPYTMVIVVTNANGEIVSEESYFTPWYKEGKYVCPDVVLKEQYRNQDPLENLYVKVGYLRNPVI